MLAGQGQLDPSLTPAGLRKLVLTDHVLGVKDNLSPDVELPEEESPEPRDVDELAAEVDSLYNAAGDEDEKPMELDSDCEDMAVD